MTTNAITNRKGHEMKMRRMELKEARLALGLSALAFGELAGIREERVFAVERGRYRPRKAEASAWAKALGLKVADAFPELFAGQKGANP
jgi:transcriptional regulator with XRE-family HTH domain